MARARDDVVCGIALSHLVMLLIVTTPYQLLLLATIMELSVGLCKSFSSGCVGVCWKVVKSDMHRG